MPIIVLIADWVTRLLVILLVVYSLMSWFVPYPKHGWQRTITSVAELILRPIRQIVPAAGGMDFSPMVAVLLLYLLRSILLRGLAA